MIISPQPPSPARRQGGRSSPAGGCLPLTGGRRGHGGSDAQSDDELDALVRFHQAENDHKLDLLRRLDFEVPNDVSSFEYLQAMYAVATEDMGLSDDQFNTMDHRLFVARLERHVRDDEFQRQVLAEVQRKREFPNKEVVSPSSKRRGRPPSRITTRPREIPGVARETSQKRVSPLRVIPLYPLIQSSAPRTAGASAGPH